MKTTKRERREGTGERLAWREVAARRFFHSPCPVVLVLLFDDVGEMRFGFDRAR